MASTRRERRIKEYGLSEVYTSEDPVVEYVLTLHTSHDYYVPGDLGADKLYLFLLA